MFRLLGADIYRVLAIEALPGRELPPAEVGPALLPALRRSVDALREECRSLESLLDTLGSCLERHFALDHQMLLMLDETGARLYIVASRGYPSSGAGRRFLRRGGDRRRRANARRSASSSRPPNTPMAGRSASRSRKANWPTNWRPRSRCRACRPSSQLAVPVLAGDRLMAVLYVESEQQCRFGYDHEDALVALCAQVGLAMCALQACAHEEGPSSPPAAAAAVGAPLRVRHFGRDNSIFIDDDYLIKGVAGAILWKLLREHAQSGRCEFSNRELRLDLGLRLPELCDNLDARLILLSRRLADRCEHLRIERPTAGASG